MKPILHRPHTVYPPSWGTKTWREMTKLLVGSRIFSVSHLEGPMARINQNFFFEGTCINVFPQEGNLQIRTRRFIREELANYVLTDKLPTIRDAAKSLGLSVRALQRNLARERSSFSEALDWVRAHVAIEALVESRTSLLALAIDLGYADQSNFNRAFRRWFGLTPAQFRDCELDSVCRHCEKLATCLKNNRN